MKTISQLPDVRQVQPFHFFDPTTSPASAI